MWLDRRLAEGGVIEMEQNKDREWDDLQKVNSKFFGTFDGSHVFGYIEELRDEIDRLQEENRSLKDVIITATKDIADLVKLTEQKEAEIWDLMVIIETFKGDLKRVCKERDGYKKTLNRLVPTVDNSSIDEDKE